MSRLARYDPEHHGGGYGVPADASFDPGEPSDEFSLRMEHAAAERDQKDRIRHSAFLHRWAETVGADEEPRWLRHLSLVMLLAFGLAMAIWVAAWLLR